jgi:hypothetical protein
MREQPDVIPIDLSHPFRMRNFLGTVPGAYAALQPLATFCNPFGVISVLIRRIVKLRGPSVRIFMWFDSDYSIPLRVLLFHLAITTNENNNTDDISVIQTLTRRIGVKR